MSYNSSSFLHNNQRNSTKYSNRCQNQPQGQWLSQENNNASCALGPFIRLLHETFSIDDVRQIEVSVKVEVPGMGFAYKIGEVVTIALEKLGPLQNTVVLCHDALPWNFGITALMRNLAQRQLL